MTRLVAAFAVLAALAACASRPPHPEAFAFAVTGDAPYNAREELDFDAMLGVMGAERLAFVVHVGDFKASEAPCTDALYADRRARFDASPHPFVLTPGDNDWTDCRRAAQGGTDPLERLARLREIFFADGHSLGRVRLPLERQEGCAEGAGGECRCPGLPENRAWITHGVVFATAHVVGSNDNRGFDAASDAEQRCRAAANRAWIAHAFERARGPAMRGLVLFVQANPWMGRKGTFDALREQVAESARILAKPVLFAHGDTHLFRADRPFRDREGSVVENVLRLETFGSPVVGWIRVGVDPGNPALFLVEPRRKEADGG